MGLWDEALKNEDSRAADEKAKNAATQPEAINEFYDAGGVGPGNNVAEDVGIIEMVSDPELLTPPPEEQTTGGVADASVGEDTSPAAAVAVDTEDAPATADSPDVGTEEDTGDPAQTTPSTGALYRLATGEAITEDEVEYVSESLRSQGASDEDIDNALKNAKVEGREEETVELWNDEIAAKVEAAAAQEAEEEEFIKNNNVDSEVMPPLPEIPETPATKFDDDKPKESNWLDEIFSLYSGVDQKSGMVTTSYGGGVSHEALPSHTDMVKVEDLTDHEEWMQSARTMFPHFEGTDEELSTLLRKELSGISWNTLLAAGFAMGLDEKTPEYARAALKAMEIRGKTITNWDDFAWAVKNTIWDPAALLAAVAGRGTLQRLMRDGAKSMLQYYIRSSAAPMAVAGAIEGAGISTAQAYTDEKLREMGLGEEFSSVDVTLSAMGMTAGFAAGSVLIGSPFYARQVPKLVKEFKAVRASNTDEIARKSTLDANSPIETKGNVVDYNGKKHTVEGYDHGWVRLVDGEGNRRNVRKAKLSKWEDVKPPTEPTAVGARVVVEGTDGTFTVKSKGGGWIKVVDADGVEHNVRAKALRLADDAIDEPTAGTQKTPFDEAEPEPSPADVINTVDEPNPPTVVETKTNRVLDADESSALMDEARELVEAKYADRIDDMYADNPDRVIDLIEREYEKLLRERGITKTGKGKSAKTTGKTTKTEQEGTKPKQDTPEPTTREAVAKTTRHNDVDPHADPSPAQTRKFERITEEDLIQSEKTGVPIIDFFNHPMSANLRSLWERFRTRQFQPDIGPEDHMARRKFMHKSGLQISQKWQREEWETLGAIWQEQLSRLSSLARQIEATREWRNTPLLIAEFSLEKMRLDATEAMLKGARTPLQNMFQWGLGLNNAYRMGPTATAQMTRKLIRYNGGIKSLTGNIEAVASGKNPAELAYYARMRRAGLWDTIVRARYNWMLSSIRTHAANMIGSGAAAMIEGVKYPMAVGFNQMEYMFAKKFPKLIAPTSAEDALTNGVMNPQLMDEMDRIWLLSPNEWVQSNTAAFHDILRIIPKMWRKEGLDGANVIDVSGKIGAEYRNFGMPEDRIRMRYNGEDPDWLPVRALEMMDTTFKAFHFRRSLYRDAKRHAKAMDQNETGTLRPDMTYQERMNYWLANPTPDMVRAANEHAAKATFTADTKVAYGGLVNMYAKSMSAAQHSHPVGQLLVPFVNTPANLLGYALQHSAFGPMNMAGGRLRQIHNDPIARAEFVSRLPIAAGLMYAALELYEAGYITGEGSTNYRVNRSREAMGIYNNSFYLGGSPQFRERNAEDGEEFMNWSFQLDRLDPAALIINMHATTFETLETMKDNDDRSALLMASVFHTADMIMDRSFMNTYMTHISAIQSQSDAKAVNLLSGVLNSMLVINGYRDLRSASDNVVRSMSPNKGDNPFQQLFDKTRAQWMNAMPGLSNKLPPRILWDGEVNTYAGRGVGGMVWRGLVPIRAFSTNTDRSAVALWMAQADITEPGQTISIDWAPESPSGGPISLNLRAMDEFGFVHSKYQEFVGAERKLLMDKYTEEGGKYERRYQKAYDKRFNELVSIDSSPEARDEAMILAAQAGMIAVGPNSAASADMAEILTNGRVRGQKKFLKWLRGVQNNGGTFGANGGTVTVKIKNEYNKNEIKEIVRALYKGTSEQIKAIDEYNKSKGNIIQFSKPVIPPSTGASFADELEQENKDEKSLPPANL